MNAFQVGEHFIRSYRLRLMGVMRVRKSFGFYDVGYRIKAEPVNPFFKPPLDHIMKLVDHHRVVPVQIRLILGV
ncbi:hypothetical protein D3C77_258190 [compost metagenome]